MSERGDPEEQEAEHFADRVMRMPEEEHGEGPSCSGCKGVQRAPEERAISAEHDAPVSLDSFQGGRPLDAASRSFFEPRFGRDFSKVRVHADEHAATAATALRAQAFTYGPNIAFSRGRYAPEGAEGRRLLAHELSHVVQQGHAPRIGGGDAIPQPARVMPYRTGKANFGKCDAGTLVEKRWNKKSKKNDPWIETIQIKFSGTKVDTDGDVVPTGTLVAKYHGNAAALSDIKTGIVGGKAAYGLNDRVTNKAVTRIEGCGYNQTPVPKADRATGDPRGKHFKASKADQANMSFAVFIIESKASGNQAIHEGSMTYGSLSCVHTPETPMRQINFHSKEGLTKVTVDYDAGALKKACCARFQAVGKMVSNPCGKQDSKKC